MNIFKSFFKSRDKPRNASVGTSWFHIGRSWSGKAVTERTALQQTAVYACVRIIAETIASLPLHLYKYTDNGKEKDCNYGFQKIENCDKYNPLGQTWKLAENIGSGYFWSYYHNDMFGIKIHDFSFFHDTIIESDLPEGGRVKFWTC